MNERWKDLAVAIGALLVILSASGAFTALRPRDYVEVKDYQGENLGSINDFRENSIKGPQFVNAEDYILEIKGLVQTPVSYTYDDILEDNPSYEKIVTIYCVEGWDVTLLWVGVRVMDLLEEAGALPMGDTLIFHAYDGYTTSLSLDFVKDNNLILAHTMNNVTLPPERGFPFQLVAEEKWGYKWIKWVTAIEVSSNEEYEGFWESRGYSNDGDLDQSFFD